MRKLLWDELKVRNVGLKVQCHNLTLNTCHPLKVRYLSAERLAGLERLPYGYFGDSGINNGFNIHQSNEYHNLGLGRGLSTDAIMTLKEKLDVRIKVEATLAQLFERNIRLVEEGGKLIPMIKKNNCSREYKLKNDECHGLKELITLLAILYDDDNNCLIIDEPELHLHPQFQSFLLQEIRQIAGDPSVDPRKKCFFLITHSPYFVDIRTPEDLKNCVVFQPEQVPTYIDQLDVDDEWKVKRLLPRLNTHHKQFFFASNPLFVEGYTDQQLFSLIQERRGKLLGASGSCIIDVGGKEELDLFYRLCKKLNINAQFIADLDALFQGNLRQSISKDDRCKSYLLREGAGKDLMDAIGQVERDISDCLKELNLPKPDEINPARQQFCDALKEASDIAKKRYIFLVGLKLIRSDVEYLVPRSEMLTLIEGRLQKVIEAFEQCGVYILSKGELENYSPSLEGNPYQISQKAKNNVFGQERDYILGSSTYSDICLRYQEIINILDKASHLNEVDIDIFLNYEIGEWIHKVQSAFIRGEVKDKESLENYRNHNRVEWNVYSRIFELLEFSSNSDDFLCRIKLKSNVDSKEREFAFDKDVVAANFKLGTTKV